MSLPAFRAWSLAAALLWCPTSSPAKDPPRLPPLSTIPGSPRLPGKFVWADLVTDDLAATRTFYAQLFGWRFVDVGGYAIAYNDHGPLGGIFQTRRPSSEPEARPRWFGYISVKNVPRAVKTVTQAGGRVLAPPRTFPKRGEQAVLADPEGAVFGVIKSDSGDPADFLPEPGDWIWAQLLSRDARQAGEFYRRVAGYEILPADAGHGLSDFVLASGGFARATLRTLPKRLPNIKPNWLPFVRVKHAAETVTLAKQLGGRALFEPSAEILNGQVAVLTDPTGAAFGILEWPENLTQGDP